jgi:hypothetical protein
MVNIKPRSPLAGVAFSSGGGFGVPNFPLVGRGFVMFHGDQMCASNMPLNSNLGDAHIVAYFGVGVTGSVEQIAASGLGRSRPR